MQQMRPPLLIVLPKKGFARRLRYLASNLLMVFPSAKYDLQQLYDSFDPEDYITAAILSAAIAGAMFGTFIFIITTTQQESAPMTGLLLGFLAAVSLLAFYLFYPGILIRKIAQQTDNDLVFALLELSLQIESGVTLFEGMVNIAQSDFGYVSREFTIAVREINSGVPEKRALQRMALRSESEFLKKIVWQIITSIESGAPLGVTLRTIVEDLMVQRFRMIKGYSQSLNFLILMYMLIAAALPSIGMTFIIILSTFSGLGLTEEFYIFLIFASFLWQAGLIGYIFVSRPSI